MAGAYTPTEEQGEGTAQELFDFTYASYPGDDEFWQVPPGAPGPGRIFDAAVYDRGAMTVHQLRLAIGDEAFFALLPAWTAAHRHGNATTAQFQALAERISGLDLDDFFTTWLLTPGRRRWPGRPARPARRPSRGPGPSSASRTGS
ncbi:M1 family aminopeptidase [Micromonospora sp. DT178]|uniref:M1 family aminopeptidase n=1 Tax=Micromonospora sp. DT178 TaxID=3393436 RepID=UPI003CED4BF5